MSGLNFPSIVFIGGLVDLYVQFSVFQMLVGIIGRLWELIHSKCNWPKIVFTLKKKYKSVGSMLCQWLISFLKCTWHSTSCCTKFSIIERFTIFRAMWQSTSRDCCTDKQKQWQIAATMSMYFLIWGISLLQINWSKNFNVFNRALTDSTAHLVSVTKLDSLSSLVLNRFCFEPRKAGNLVENPMSFKKSTESRKPLSRMRMSSF